MKLKQFIQDIAQYYFKCIGCKCCLWVFSAESITFAGRKSLIFSQFDEKFTPPAFLGQVSQQLTGVHVQVKCL